MVSPHFLGGKIEQKQKKSLHFSFSLPFLAILKKKLAKINFFWIFSSPTIQVSQKIHFLGRKKVQFSLQLIKLVLKFTKKQTNFKKKLVNFAKKLKMFNFQKSSKLRNFRTFKNARKIQTRKFQVPIFSKNVVFLQLFMNI